MYLYLRSVTQFPGEAGEGELNWHNVRWSEELLKHDVHAPRHLGQEEVFAHAVHGALAGRVPALRLGQPEAWGRWS